MLSEREALLKETLMPVYVVPEDEQLLYMYEEVKQAAAMHASSIFIRGERNQEKHAKQPCTRVEKRKFFLHLSSGSPSKYDHSYSFSDLSQQQRADKGHHRQRCRDSGGETFRVQTRRNMHLNDVIWPGTIHRSAVVYFRECCLEMEKMYPP